MQNTDSLLSALRANAIFSIVSALLMAVSAGWVADQIGLDEQVSVFILSGFLAVFALQLFNIVRTKQIRTAEILAIIASDLAWVVGTIVLAAMYYESFTLAGLLLVDVVAAVVLILAILQIRGLRSLHQSRSV